MRDYSTDGVRRYNGTTSFVCVYCMILWFKPVGILCPTLLFFMYDHTYVRKYPCE